VKRFYRTEHNFAASWPRGEANVQPSVGAEIDAVRDAGVWEVYDDRKFRDEAKPFYVPALTTIIFVFV